MPNYSRVPFIIIQFQNKTDLALELVITSLDRTIQQKISLAPHDVHGTNLPFGRSEDSEYPLGYSITNMDSDIPFKSMILSYERTEDPLADVFREHTELIRKRFVHHWTLRVDGKIVGSYKGHEGTCHSYKLVIEPQRVYAEIAAL